VSSVILYSLSVISKRAYLTLASVVSAFHYAEQNHTPPNNVAVFCPHNNSHRSRTRPDWRVYRVRQAPLKLWHGKLYAPFRLCIILPSTLLAKKNTRNLLKIITCLCLASSVKVFRIFCTFS